MKQAGWQNLKSDVKTYWKGILAAAVFLMAMLLLFGQLCPLRILVGLPCPACGLTRAGLYVLSLQFHRAWEMNPVIYPIALFVLYFIVCRYLLGKKVWGWRWMLWVLLILLVAVYIYRMGQYFPQKRVPYVTSATPMEYDSNNLFHWLLQSKDK